VPPLRKKFCAKGWPTVPVRLVAWVPLMVSPEPVKVAGRDRPGGREPETTARVPPAWWLVSRCPW
jgi:hypothetical protein